MLFPFLQRLFRESAMERTKGERDSRLDHLVLSVVQLLLLLRQLLHQIQRLFRRFLWRFEGMGKGNLQVLFVLVDVEVVLGGLRLEGLRLVRH